MEWMWFLQHKKIYIVSEVENNIKYKWTSYFLEMS